MKTKASKQMFTLVSKVLTKARAKQNIKVLLAVSGGQDSSVMLDFFSELSKRDSTVEIVVAHFDHGLRDGSARDLKFVREFAKKLEVKFVSECAESFDGASNMESWARQHRYDFLEKHRKELGCDFIATAHHMQDQSETLLMRFINGRFATSANGIAEIDHLRSIIRPFLFCSKELIEQYSEQHSVEFVLDPTNIQTKMTRNWIRHKLLPLIRSGLNPSLDQTMSYMAERFSADEIFLMEAAKEVFDLKGRESEEVIFLKSQPEAIRWRLLSLIAQEHCGFENGVVGYLPMKRLSMSIYDLDSYESKTVELGLGWSCKFKMKENVKFFRSS